VRRDNPFGGAVQSHRGKGAAVATDASGKQYGFAIR
jgi:hypothetical protein